MVYWRKLFFKFILTLLLLEWIYFNYRLDLRIQNLLCAISKQKIKYGLWKRMFALENEFSG